ncbi:MAG: hypothetical protein DLM57_06070, partial [Pseudonocardiales bacterium]
MWGRKKQKDEPAAQASIETAAPASYWATHAEPDASAPSPRVDQHEGGQAALPAVGTALIVNGKPVDPESPEGRSMLALMAHAPKGTSVTRTTITVNGREIDPDSPEGRQLQAVASGEQAYALPADDQDGAAKYVFSGTAGREQLTELLPFIEKHRRHEITDAELEAA